MNPNIPTFSSIKVRPGQRLEIGASEKIFWTKELAVVYTRKICDLYSSGKYTLTEACSYFGIKITRFRKWTCPAVDIEQLVLDGLPLPKGFVMECREMYAAAKEIGNLNFRDNLKDLTRKGILKRVEGYDDEEITVEQELDMRTKLENGEPNPNFGTLMTVKQKIKKKRVAPDVSMLIFTSTNIDPDNFKHRNVIEHAGSVDIGANNLESLSDTQLLQKKKELQIRLDLLEQSKRKTG